MGQMPAKGSLAVVLTCLAATACSSSSTSSSGSPPVASSSAPTSATIPAAKTVAQPAIYGYYDGHIDTMLSTDVSDKSQATSQHINYAPAMVTASANTYPSLYTVMGPAAPNQPVVFGSEPGETDYSPLWHEIDVRWTSRASPVLLVRDDQIKELATKGELTMDSTSIVLNCPIVKVS